MRGFWARDAKPVVLTRDKIDGIHLTGTCNCVPAKVCAQDALKLSAEDDCHALVTHWSSDNRILKLHQHARHMAMVSFVNAVHVWQVARSWAPATTTG
jgi:hypothetical protein